MIARLALALVVLGSALVWFSAPVADNDLWGHVLFGRQILASGLPETNGLAYTAFDFPWINHEIVAEVAFAWGFDTAGPPGLVLVRLAVAAATLAFVAAAVRRRTKSLEIAAIVVMIVASLAADGFLVRPQIFSYLFLAILCDRLHAESQTEARASWWLLPFLFAIWINAHGGVLAGLGIAGVHALSPDATASSRRRRLVVVALSTVALLANPYGVDLLLFLAHDVTLERPIPEWFPIPLADASNLGFKAAVVVLALGVVLGAASRQRGDRWEPLALALAAVMAFRHQRHLPLFAILAAPALGEILDTLAGEARRLRPFRAGLSAGARNALAAGLGVIGVAQIAASVRVQHALDYGLFVAPTQFPVEAFRFLAANRLGGKVAVPFGWGEYALWHLPPGSLVSIDGRYTTAYPEPVIDDAWRYMDGGPGWERHLVAADLAVADRMHATAERMAGLPEWTRIHEDPTAIVFARTEAAKERTFEGVPPARVVETFP